MRSRIRSLQELRCHADTADGGGAPLAGGPRSGAERCPPSQPPSKPLHLPAASTPPAPQDKLSRILSFLDEVEETSRADISSLVSSARSARPGDSDGAASELEARFSAVSRITSYGLAQDAAACQSRMSLLEVEVNDKRKTIDTLKRALTEAKEHEQQLLQETMKELEDKMQKQKTHYESGMERHLKLVDRLLTDKTELTKRCEFFNEELKAVERKFQMKIEELDERNSKELERQKKNWMAAERLRREAWEKDKVREIKEITIKGLQPEVERILAERKQERHRLEERHQEAMESQRRELTEAAQAQVRGTQERLAREQERAMDEEREAHRRKARDDFERFSTQLQEERARCAADILAERRRHEQALLQASEGLEARISEALSAERTKAEAALREALEKASSAELRHRGELSDLRRQLELEADRLRREQGEQAKLELDRREAALRQEFAAERDRQVDLLLERLGREHVEQQQALREELAQSVVQVRTAAAQEARQLSVQLKAAEQQVAALEAQQAQRTEMELLFKQEMQILRDRHTADLARIMELEQQLQRLEAESAELQGHMDRLQEEHRDELWRAGEVRDKDVEAVREELRRAELLVEKERARADEQQAATQRREESVIGDLEARVKRTLRAKDETIDELRTRCAASENKVREFEYLLARQREELLGEITGKSRG